MIGGMNVQGRKPMSAKIACLFVAVGVSAGLVRADDAAKAKVLQGAWKLESLEIDGKPAELPDSPFWWFIKGDKVLYGGSELAALTIDAETSPRCIDLGFRDPKRVFEGIYAIEDDTLKICVNPVTEGVKERPADFSTKGKPSVRLLTFKRDKDRKADSIEGLAGYVGIQIKAEDEGKQVVIVAPIPGSPADKAGLKKDDVLLKVGDQEAQDLKSVVNLIRKAKPGVEVSLRVKRDGKEKDFTVKATVLPFYLLD
jgi:uncharacterized protein (TIGR03067 family)